MDSPVALKQPLTQPINSYLKHGLSHWGKNTARIGCWVRYLDLWRTRLTRDWGKLHMRSFAICIRQVLLRWSSQYHLYSLSIITPLMKSIRSVSFVKYYSADQANTICILCQVLLRWSSQYDPYPLSSITPLIKSIRMRRAGRVTPMRETRGACKVLVGKSGSHGQRWENRKSRSSSRNAKFCYLNMGRHLCCLRSLVEIYLQTIYHKMILARGIVSGAVRVTVSYRVGLLDCYWQEWQVVVPPDTEWKHQSFRGVGSEPLHCVDVLRMTSSN
jgi:hypothetical protein